MANKVLPIDKTAVVSLNLDVVDGVRKQKILAESFPVRLLQTLPFNYTDVVVTPSAGCTLSAINALVVIYSFSPVLLDITKGAEVLHGVECSGLFALSGKIDSIVIKAPAGADPTSVSCAYA